MNHFEKFESYIPIDLTQASGFFQAFLVLFLIINIRYFVMVILLWVPYYKHNFSSKSIYKVLPTSKDQIFEIKWSIVSSIVFALIAVIWGLLWQLGYTRINLTFDFPMWYWPLNYAGLLLLHETYFYWTHRWLHLPKVYKLVHYVHHASLKPSPWASFSFHPIESIINALALPLISLFWPLHPVVILLHLTLMTVTAITNHLGYEVLPKNIGKFLSKHIVSGVHHCGHHRFYTVHYGLFFTWWDRICKTEHKNFDQQYDQVSKGKPLW